MKQYPQEIEYLKNYLKGINIPEFDQDQKGLINRKLKEIRSKAKDRPWIHNFFELLPFILIASLWYLLIFVLPEYILNKTLLFFILFTLHGFLGYQWVIYGLHEGAGHKLFTNKKSVLHRFLSFLAFHSSRLMMADPVNYRKHHQTHHKYTGTAKDGSQTNFVLKNRIMISLLPGAGILFPNNYRVHKGDDCSLSLLLSAFLGILRFAIEYQALKPYFSPAQIILMLFLLSPWIGLFLDRIRESLEHHLMPQSREYGSRELGTSLIGLIIAGGPWGQPCHLSHHLAPDLNWYQQISLSKYLDKTLTEDQRTFFGFNASIPDLITNQIQKHTMVEN